MNKTILFLLVLVAICMSQDDPSGDIVRDSERDLIDHEPLPPINEGDIDEGSTGERDRFGGFSRADRAEAISNLTDLILSLNQTCHDTLTNRTEIMDREVDRTRDRVTQLDANRTDALADLEVHPIRAAVATMRFHRLSLINRIQHLLALRIDILHRRCLALLMVLDTRLDLFLISDVIATAEEDSMPLDPVDIEQRDGLVLTLRDHLRVHLELDSILVAIDRLVPRLQERLVHVTDRLEHLVSLLESGSRDEIRDIVVDWASRRDTFLEVACERIEAFVDSSRNCSIVLDEADPAEIRLIIDLWIDTLDARHDRLARLLDELRAIVLCEAPVNPDDVSLAEHTEKRQTTEEQFMIVASITVPPAATGGPTGGATGDPTTGGPTSNSTTGAAADTSSSLLVSSIVLLAGSAVLFF